MTGNTITTRRNALRLAESLVERGVSFRVDVREYDGGRAWEFRAGGSIENEVEYQIAAEGVGLRRIRRI